MPFHTGPGLTLLKIQVLCSLFQFLKVIVKDLRYHFGTCQKFKSQRATWTIGLEEKVSYES